MTDGRSLLIVDDDAAFRERLVRAMRDRGYEARRALPTTRQRSMQPVRTAPELALVDLRRPGESGLSVVRNFKALDSSTVVVVLTGYGSMATAVEGMKLGAASYVTKPQTLIRSSRHSTERSRRTTPRPHRWLASNGSTTNESWRPAAATFRKPRES
jgi:ActR/RegA family two-component response regulator